MEIAINNAIIPDFLRMKWQKGHVGIENGKVKLVSQKKLTAKNIIDAEEKVVSPGLIDCHCHVESSYLTPYYFSQLIAKYGTLKAVADCHEIANVAGLAGVKYFIDNAKLGEININFAASSCVPSSSFVQGGGTLSIDDISELLHMKEVLALGEIMDINGVLNKDPRILAIVAIAQKLNKPINGHAAGLSGEKLIDYINIAHVGYDHDNEGANEIEEKLRLGLKIFLREGSATTTELKAYRLAEKYPDDLMYCTDDKTAADILERGHINFHLKKAVTAGLDPLLALKLGTFNGYKYYNIEGGTVAEGSPANLVLFNDLEAFEPFLVIVNGEIYKEKYDDFDIPNELLHSINVVEPNKVPALKGEAKNLVITAQDGSLITGKERLELLLPPPTKTPIAINIPDFIVEKDLLKLVNIDRYGGQNLAAARIRGFGLKKGAIGTSLSHDCHNLLVLGTNDNNIRAVVKKILQIEGGLVCFDERNYYILRLNIGGVVSKNEPMEVKTSMEQLNSCVKKLGCGFKDTFATLSFMALEVIPHLKLTSKGLFDVDANTFV
jgi:adenine deaminase